MKGWRRIQKIILLANQVMELELQVCDYEDDDSKTGNFDNF
jgi:hypothetical protein